MIERAADDPDMVFGWVTGDEAYGDNGPLRAKLEKRGLGYVMAVSRDHQVSLTTGKKRADHLVASLAADAWQRYSCGPGSKGERYYDWAWIHLDQQHFLLVRRSICDPSELAVYRCFVTGPSELVRVAGSRWSIEECFQATKNEAGLDHYQVRKRLAWYRHITLAMAAHIHLALTTAGPPPDPVPATSEDDADQGEDREGLATQGAKGLWTTKRHPAPA